MADYFDIKKYYDKNGYVMTSTCLENGKKEIINRTESNKINDRCYFIEELRSKSRLVIAGAGHVAQALAKMAVSCDFNVIVIDDRKDFANKTNFPNANVICADISNNLKSDFGDNAYYAIMTRGHKDDYDALISVLKKKYSYVGLMGSKRKVEYIKERLRSDGIDEEKINTANMPIGIDIGAVTPSEIAVSVLAELIKAQNNSLSIGNKGQGDILSYIKKDAVMTTIIKKQGSAPRGVGSKMLVYADGTIYGTIGGGSLEYDVIKTAQLMTKNFLVKEYSLSNEKASDLGMVCGGRIKVMLERI